MPYATPVSGQSDPHWTLGCRYGSASQVSLNITITVEGTATEADGDAALQELVDAISARTTFNSVNGQKAYTSSTTQTMLPSA